MILSGQSGAFAEIIEYGATVKRLVVPGRGGRLIDVVLGYDSDESYREDGDSRMGAIVGRVASRIENASFLLDGERVALLPNMGEHQLHGGATGFSRKDWQVLSTDEHRVTLGLVSPDGDCGYPGELSVEVSYTFGEDNALEIEYRAHCPRNTVFAPTSHCYFNLGGHDSGPIGEHALQIAAKEVLEMDGRGLPTGKFIEVEGTAFDFRAPKRVERGLSQPHENMLDCGGFDHCFALEGKGYREAASLSCRESGVAMRVYTDAPGLLLYTSNFLSPRNNGKDGALYDEYCALCLETGFFPNAVNHPEYESPKLAAGAEFYSKTAYAFLQMH